MFQRWNGSVGRQVLFFLTAFSFFAFLLPVGAEQTLPSVAASERHPAVFAHRGGRKWAPENTLAAFKKSLDIHVDGIELDIHKCKSGELVVIHDESVHRTTDGAGLVKDMTYDQIKKLDAGSWYAAEFKNERIPLLSDVLSLVDGKAVINIEIKNAPVEYPGIDDDLIKLLSSYKYKNKIVISSFDHEILKRIHEKAPQYKLAILLDGLLVDLGKYSAGVGAKSWNPGFELIRSDNVVQAHQTGLEVNVWTINKPEQWKSAVEMGVDGIITDNPKALIEFLGKEKQSTR
jgi:glycerophosphoryl diester phosphodiesterase